MPLCRIIQFYNNRGDTMLQIPETALHQVAHYMRFGDKLPRGSHCLFMADATYTGIYEEINTPKNQWNTYPKKALVAYSHKGEFLGIFISFIDLNLSKIKKFSVNKTKKDFVDHYKQQTLPLREPIRKKFKNSYLSEKELSYEA